jgi:hypothetical protein
MNNFDGGPMTTIKRQTAKQLLVRGCLLGVMWASAGWVHALRFEPSDEVTIDLDTTVSYGAMWRVEKRDKDRLYSTTPIDYWPRDASLIDSDLLSEGVMAWNTDDGNRNFDKGDLTSSRFAAISDFDLAYKNVGIFLRARAFYDAVYFEETSFTGKGFDHYRFPASGAGPSACETSSVAGEYCGYQDAGSISNTVASGAVNNPKHFSEEAKETNGMDIGFLDAYVYGIFNIGEHSLDLRIGRQAISWGEALMLQGGIGFAQNRLDVTAATAPGQQLKEIFLPTGAVYGQIDLTPELTLEAYWQYEWKKSVLMASDTYFAFTDFLTTDLFLTNSRFTTHCAYGSGTTVRNGQGCDNEVIQVYGNPTYSTAAPEIEPDNPEDQFGVALRLLLENGSEAGLYYVRYHDRYPSFWAGNNGGEFYAGPNGAPVTTPGLNSGRYTVQYQEGINLIGLTYNTVIGDIQMGFELTWRENQPVVPVCSAEQLAASYSIVADNDGSTEAIGNPGFVAAGQPGVTGDLSLASPAIFQTPCKDPSVYALARKQYWGKDVPDGPGSQSGWNVGAGTLETLADKMLSWPTQAEVWTYNVGMTAVTPPTPIWDTGIFVAEVGGWYVGSGYEDEDLRVSQIGSFTQRGVGVSAIFLPQYKNIWEGIDLTLPVFVNYTIDGSFAYFNYTKGALWTAIGAEAVYLSNLTVGVTYNTYGGDHIWKDRDNVSFSIKYSF